MLQVEAPDVGAPDQVQLRRHPLRPVPPQPQNPGFAPPLASWQPLDLHQDERPDHYGQEPAATLPFVVPNLRMQVGPSPEADRPVAGIFADVFGGGFGPGRGIRALHLRPVAARPSGLGGRTGKAGIAKEAAPGAQTDEYLARAPFEPLLHLDGIVTRVEDEKGDGFSLPEPIQQALNLLGGDHVGILSGPDALHVQGGGPTLAHEVEPGEELVGPPGHDGLPRRVARGVVVEALVRGYTPRRIGATR